LTKAAAPKVAAFYLSEFVSKKPNTQEGNVIINMKPGATESEIENVIAGVRLAGFKPHVVYGTECTIVAAVGTEGNRSQLEALESAAGVQSAIAVSHPFKLVSRLAHRQDSIVDVSGVAIGGEEPVVIAGPCSVESREQILTTARAVKKSGARLLRGGAYKPRTSPYEFSGLGKEALQLLAEARAETGLPVVTEIMSTEDVDLVSEYADMLQVGARNMQNFALLRRLASVDRPILLKRGPAATVKEWLLAAEYLLAGGNPDVVLCERGIKTFEPETRNTLDLAAVALAKELSHLPVIADPSHGTGRRSLIGPLSAAALAVGAAGIIVEVHPCPERALSDGAQSLNFQEFAAMMNRLAQPARSLNTKPKTACADSRPLQKFSSITRSET
jgi:3-deoxy-7-phosphoheptulonate synthase